MADTRAVPGGQGVIVVNWLRKHLKHGSRLALFAIAIQLALSWGHFHTAAAPAGQIGLTGASRATATPIAAQEAHPEAAQPQQPAGPANDQHTANVCAVCAVLSLAKNFLFITPPVLELPGAVELLYLVTSAEFAHLSFSHLAFQSRAPPAF
ncbi:DUF2946 family protein [Nitrobacter winogradskyi]|uniref:Uncharacterized protein n=2 Tax=Nitrobacter winogradskyi TaxID=913 RepID=A0ACC6AN90_NITWI|nr:DUF2946 family protein [Nitrobacter winogradskyi]MCP2001328.1 hypothetical protein [Nitrobacter winogradskyi]GEC15384.1 hypothetical protein NWI01_12760 [Nitrobacter winogradskyi]